MQLSNSLIPRSVASSNYLLRQYGGAAAAYSLQRLDTSVENVVRARRSTDDAEADFTAQEVSGGSLREFALNNDADLVRFADQAVAADERMYFDGVDDAVTLGNIVTSGRLECSFALSRAQTQYTFLLGRRTTAATDEALLEFRDAGGLKINASLNGQRDAVSATLEVGRVYEIAMAWESGVVELFLDGVSQGTDTYTGSVTANPLLVGRQASVGPAFNGIIFEVKQYSDVAGTTLVGQWNGYGNTNADWEDQVGSDDGTVSGSPALFSGQGFDAYVTTLYDQSGALGQPLSRFAQHATAADTRMQFDGSNDNVTFADNAVFDLTTYVDIRFKFFITATAANQCLISKGAGSASNYVIDISGGNFRFFGYDGSSVLHGHIGAGFSPALNTVYEIQATFDGTDWTVTANGSTVISTTDAATLATNSSVFAVGSRAGAANFLNGSVWDVEIYDNLAAQTFGANGYGNTNADWEDQVGSNNGTVAGSPSIYEGRNALQATAASQPQIVADGVVVTDSNGNAAMDFDGSDDAVISTGFTVSQANTWFVAFELDSGNTGAIYDSGGISVNRQFMDTSPSLWRFFAGTSVTGYAFTTNPAIASTIMNGASSKLYIDGSENAAGDIGSNAIDGITIGNNNGVNDPMTGTVSELILYPSDQSSNRAAIEANIGSRYEITTGYADLYLEALQTAGASPTSTQANAIKNFVRTGESEGWFSSLKRFYLPIWGAAGPNAIDLISRASGTFNGSVTHGAGYVQGDGSTGYFDFGVTPSALGLTLGSGGIFALIKEEATGTAAYNILGSIDTVSVSSAVDFQIRAAGEGVARFYYADFATLSSFACSRSDHAGIICAQRAGGDRNVRRRTSSGVSSLLSATVADSGVIPTTRNFIAMGTNYAGTPAALGNQEMGAYGVTAGLANANSDAFTLALKNLWETTTGLTLP